MSGIWDRVQSIADQLAEEERQRQDGWDRGGGTPIPLAPTFTPQMTSDLPNENDLFWRFKPQSWPPAYQDPSIAYYGQSESAAPQPMGLLQPGSYEAAINTTASAGQGPTPNTAPTPQQPTGLLQPGSYEAAMASAAKAGQASAPIQQGAPPMENITVTGQRLPATSPTSAYRQGGNVVYVHPDGTKEIWNGGTLDWRTNNPGSLGDTPFSDRHGAIGGPINGRAIFPDPETGRAAMDALMRSPSYQGNTVDEFVTRYAGPKNPDLPNYLPFVRNQTGVPGTTPTQQLTPQQWDAMTKAMRIFEGTREGTVNLEQPLP